MKSQTLPKVIKVHPFVANSKDQQDSPLRTIINASNQIFYSGAKVNQPNDIDRATLDCFMLNVQTHICKPCNDLALKSSSYQREATGLWFIYNPLQLYDCTCAQCIIRTRNNKGTEDTKVKSVSVAHSFNFKQRPCLCGHEFKCQ